jgi:hypothetical protein
MNTDKIYQRIGELVVGFQFLEDLYRQIGWFLLDPRRAVWPPTGLRTERTEQLVKEVSALYEAALPTLQFEHETEVRASFREIAARFHLLRRLRNRVLHSAYVEIKSGGELVALLRSDIRGVGDEKTLKVLPDQEVLSDTSFDNLMNELGAIAVELQVHYKQLLMRMP